MVKKRRSAKPKVVSKKTAKKTLAAAKRAIKTAKAKVAKLNKSWVPAGYNYNPYRARAGAVIATTARPRVRGGVRGASARPRVVVPAAAVNNMNPANRPGKPSGNRRSSVMPVIPVPMTTDPRVYPDMPGMAF